MSQRPSLLFVSPRFLFPADSGGKIRTGQVLRGMLGGHFHITLASPASPEDTRRYAGEIKTVADRFVSWPEPVRGRLFRLFRLRHLLSSMPVAVVSDRCRVGEQLVAEALAARPDIVVLDFPHAAVLARFPLPSRSVMFTHNVEAEIFERHVQVATNAAQRLVWSQQHRKMRAYEKRVLNGFDTVVAVSQRDSEQFSEGYGLRNVRVIPTGVDLDYFDFRLPADTEELVFIGSMDWLANIDAIEYLMQEIWPRVVAAMPAARMSVVGRNPPSNLVEKARNQNLSWTFTGFVDDIRPHVARAALCVIPLRVGGGTRIKAYEAMAMGSPIVSTSIGVEGLPVEEGRHYLRGDSAAEFAAAVVALLQDRRRRETLAREARAYVEANFSYAEAAREFENICRDTMELQSVFGSHR